MIPEDLKRGGNSYQVTHVAGYYLAGSGELKLNQIFTITSGVGIKTLNFNFERIFFEAIPPTGCRRSIALCRLYFYIVPVDLRINLSSDSAYFFMIGAEYSHLVRDVNWELWFRPDSRDEQSDYLELYKWFKPDATFFYLGGGFNINAKFAVIIKAGISINRVDRAETQPYETYYRSNFYFSKRLAELNFALQYKF
jgi:hypothetical protein